MRLHFSAMKLNSSYGDHYPFFFKHVLLVALRSWHSFMTTLPDISAICAYYQSICSLPCHVQISDNYAKFQPLVEEDIAQVNAGVSLNAQWQSEPITAENAGER